jgi:hypothetical protein
VEFTQHKNKSVDSRTYLNLEKGGGIGNADATKMVAVVAIDIIRSMELPVPASGLTLHGSITSEEPLRAFALSRFSLSERAVNCAGVRTASGSCCSYSFSVPWLSLCHVVMPLGLRMAHFTGFFVAYRGVCLDLSVHGPVMCINVF